MATENESAAMEVDTKVEEVDEIEEKIPECETPDRKLIINTDKNSIQTGEDVLFEKDESFVLDYRTAWKLGMIRNFLIDYSDYDEANLPEFNLRKVRSDTFRIILDYLKYDVENDVEKKSEEWKIPENTFEELSDYDDMKAYLYLACTYLINDGLKKICAKEIANIFYEEVEVKEGDKTVKKRVGIKAIDIINNRWKGKYKKELEEYQDDTTTDLLAEIDSENGYLYPDEKE